MLCRMGASSAMSVRAIASFTKANAGCALYAPGKTSRSCSPPTVVVGLLHRSDREKAAQSFSTRHTGPVVWHRRVQLDLQVLPELGHLQGPRSRSDSGRSLP